VRLLRSVLGPKARVGTVDRFQGQEAPCLAVVVASPRLAEAPVRSVRQLREVNFLARIREVGGATPEIDGDEPPLGGG
ncbi:hypothetical protein EMIHUDRAFT_252329, partial [Emiliania huxleyi CCMP1516]